MHSCISQEFKKTGMNAAQARKVLTTWEKAGVKDPEALRKLLLQRTLPSVTGPLLQALVDSSICFGGRIPLYYLYWVSSSFFDLSFEL